jgi:hypothetical protein
MTVKTQQDRAKSGLVQPPPMPVPKPMPKSKSKTKGSCK